MRLLEDERESWRLLLEEAQREGEFSMFVKIGEMAINLNNVLFIERGTYDNRACVKIWFSGLKHPLYIFPKEPGYAELVAFIEEQTALLHD